MYETVEHGEAKGIACAKAETNVSIKLVIFVYFVYVNFGRLAKIRVLNCH